MTDDEWAALRSKLLALAIVKFGPEHADDIVQEAIVRFLDRAPQVRPDRTAAYLYRVVVNVGINRWRRRTSSGRFTTNRLGFQVKAPGDLAEEAETRDELARAAELLGPGVVDLMADYREQGSKALAVGLGISAPYLRVLLHHARRMIRDQPIRGRGSRLRKLRRLAEVSAR